MKDSESQTVKRDRSVCRQLMLLDLLRLSRAVGEASSGKLSGKLNFNDVVPSIDLSVIVSGPFTLKP